MALEIGVREREGVHLLDLEGRITVGEESSALREKIRDLSAQGACNFILNLEQVDYIDSTGLGAMVMCFTTLRKAGGRLKLEKLNRRNVELLVLTKLTTIFEIFSDEQSAVNSFFPGREVHHFDILSFVREQTEE
jgi:anti-sigma B factor antagonist